MAATAYKTSLTSFFICKTTSSSSPAIKTISAMSCYATITNVTSGLNPSRARRVNSLFSPKNLLHVQKKSEFHNTSSSLRFNRYYDDCYKQQYYKKISHHRVSACSSRSASTEINNSNVVGSTEEIPQPRSSSLWADEQSFSSDDRVEEEYVKEIKFLKEDVRKRLTRRTENDNNPKDKVILVDTLERIGVSHHFEKEIEDLLQRIMKSNKTKVYKEEERDLFTTSLYFRLLRQHGYDVPCSVFDKFKDDDNTFKTIHSHNDTEALLSLYEASFVRYHEEGILQIARDRARRYLIEVRPSLESHLNAKVTRALLQPLHWAPSKVEARHYISIYEQHQSKDETILRLGKLDFYFSQKLYTKELNEVAKWLNSFENLKSQLPYVRKTLSQCYFWAAGLSYEPQYSLSRISATKTLIMCVFLNDTYESHATMEQLELFTQIVLSWDTDIERINKLPENIKILYEALLKTFAEFESELQERSYLVHYVKESMKQLVWVYHTKAKWYKGKHHFPTFQEHVETGANISGITQMLPAFYMHMESASKEIFDWLMTMPEIVEQSSLYARYLNDITSYDREHESGQFPTAIDCYMKEKGLSKEETFKRFAEFGEGSWMTINKEWTEATFVPKDILKPVVGAARIVFASYGQGLDGFTFLNGELYNHSAALFEPVTI